MSPFFPPAPAGIGEREPRWGRAFRTSSEAGVSYGPRSTAVSAPRATGPDVGAATLAWVCFRLDRSRTRSSPMREAWGRRAAGGRGPGLWKP